MAGLFDQYERASAKAASRGTAVKQQMQEPVSSGFINARIEEDVPIFNKQRINFDPPEPIVRLQVCNSFLVMAMRSNILLRIDLEHPDSPDEVELTKSSDDYITNIFLDPTSQHLIVAMSSAENYYLSRKAKKARVLTKLKGYHMTAVGWNRRSSTDVATGDILIGTAKGAILETSLVPNEERLFSASLEQYIKQVYTVSHDQRDQVTAIEFDRLPSASATQHRYFIIVTVPGRLYQFLGSVSVTADSPVLQPIFSSYENIPERFLELPGSFGYSELKLYHPSPAGLPTSFVWMAGPGLYYGNIDTTVGSEADSVTTNTKIIPYSKDDSGRQSPLSVVLTEFHVLILFPDRLTAFCVLNDELVYDDVSFERFGDLMGVCRDLYRGTVWAYSSKAVFKYILVREDRDVWQLYLSQGDFELAKQFSQENLSNYDKVLTRQAMHLFDNKNYLESAKVYAETRSSFEEIALKFISLDDKHPLRMFLLNKLKTFKPQDKTQVTMLIMWLIEIWLNQMGLLKEQSPDKSGQYESMQADFRRFLEQPRVKECASENRHTVYELISSHGIVDDLMNFAELIQDYERMISYYLQQEDYRSALMALDRQRNIELFYKFSPLFIQNIPKETVESWMRRNDRIEPRKLIPAMVQYNHSSSKTDENHAIRYLEYVTQKLNNTDTAIHNYLLSLYAKLKPDKLMQYLNIQGQEKEQVNYDLKYALRLCSDLGLNEACVHIYTTMELYEEAVDLALQVNVDIAKDIANKPEDNEELQRKLWLKIARHVVEKEKDIKRAMEFLQECDLLKIEDILPFFPDFVTINHFKEAICTSLQDYSQHIETLKAEMDEATESAEEIRNEIQNFRNKFVIVQGQDKCSHCSYPLTLKPFYVFPCHHKFHLECLVSEVLPHLSGNIRTKVADAMDQLSLLERSPTHSAGSQSESARSEQNLKSVLDELVAAECIYCGDLMIRSVDQPFIDPQEYDQLILSWL